MPTREWRWRSSLSLPSVLGLTGQTTEDQVQPIVEVPVGVPEEEHTAQPAEVLEIIDGQALEDRLPLRQTGALVGGLQLLLGESQCVGEQRGEGAGCRLPLDPRLPQRIEDDLGTPVGGLPGHVLA